MVPALGWHLAETAALLAEASFYVGNDTGVMNMAAAVGTRAYALFGTTPALHHSPHIVPIVSRRADRSMAWRGFRWTPCLAIIERSRIAGSDRK